MTDEQIIGALRQAEALDTDRNNLLRIREELNEELKSIFRKEAAKKICEIINKWREELKYEKDNPLYAFYMGLGVVVDEFSEKYGVEVKE